MKNKIIFIICSLLIVLSSCRTKQKITEAINTSQVESTYIHDKLTPRALPKDSAHLKALFECDSTNKVILKQLFDVTSKGVNATFNYQDGLLDYMIRTGGDTIYIPGRDYYWIVHNQINKTVTITKTVKIEKRLSWIQKFMIVSARIFYLLFFIVILYYIVKYAIKIKRY